MKPSPSQQAGTARLQIVRESGTDEQLRDSMLEAVYSLVVLHALEEEEAWARRHPDLLDDPELNELYFLYRDYISDGWRAWLERALRELLDALCCEPSPPMTLNALFDYAEQHFARIALRDNMQRVAIRDRQAAGTRKVSGSVWQVGEDGRDRFADIMKIKVPDGFITCKE